MAQIKISELDELIEVTGEEMLPIQLDDATYKLSVDAIIERGKEVLHSIQKYNYDDLKQLKDSKLLIPGEHYILTDYQCIYIQPVSLEVMTSEYDGWLLMLHATSEDSFSNDADVFFTEDSTYVANGGKPILSCKYLFDNFYDYQWSDTTSKGIIIDLEDSSHNRCSYDFKHIKFRRWALKDVTENDTVGAADQPSCYRCYGTDDEPKRSDGRSWVGSGLEAEKKYIKSIFDGTFNSVMWGQEALHEDYITKIHKPFKRTDERLQYVAFDTTLESLSHLTESVPGLVKFEIDSEDYIDCYTFECDGFDFSNVKNILRNTVKCNNPLQLPNTVVLRTSLLQEDIEGQIWGNDLHTKDVTIAMFSIESYKPILNRVICEDLRSSVLNVFRMYLTKFNKYCGCNYISGSLYDCTLEGLQCSVLFGHYSSVNMSACIYNLLFGNNQLIIKADGTLTTPQDGNYWYDDVIQDWFGYNIMAPFQYAVFYPHTNTNTVKLPYNKGVTLMGTFQDNFVERMRWGVVVLYGGCQGQYLTELTSTSIDPQAFVSQVAHSSGISSIYRLEGAPQFPSISNADVKMYLVNLKSLASNLTSEVKEKLATRDRRKIFTNTGTSPVIKYYSEL